MDNKPDSFWKLLEPEHKRAMIFCRKLAGDRDRGDDLYQDALLLAYGNFPNLRDPKAFRSWLYRILINRFISAARRPWWKRRLSLKPEILRHLKGEDPTDLHNARRLLEKAFRAVSAEEKALVTLYELEGWPIRELAELLEISESAVKVRLFRARKKMKRALVKHARQSGMTRDAAEILRKECNAMP